MSFSFRALALVGFSGLALGLGALFAPAAEAQDATPPTISSIVRQAPATSPTNADSVTWRLTFDEAVQTVTPGMFTSTGSTGTLAVTNNSSTQTDVTLSGGDMASLNGVVTLDALVGPPALTNVANITDNATLKLNGAASVTTGVVGGTTFLFAAGAIDDGVSVFSVAANGSLTNVANVTDDATLELDGAYSVTTAVVGGITYLFAAGVFDDGVSVFSVAANGSLTNVANVTDDATLELAGSRSVTTAVVGGITYLFAAGSFDAGVSVFSVAADGSLTNITNVPDDATLQLDGAISVTTSMVGGITYLFAAGQNDSGVSVFSVEPNASGTVDLTNVANVTDDDDATFELRAVRSVTTAVVGGTTYLFAAGQNDDGVSVFSVEPNASGTVDLTNVANVTDNATLELDDARSLTTAVVGGITHLFAAGAIDNGVSWFAVADGGSLTNVANITDDGSGGALELGGAASVTTAAVGGTTYLFAAGYEDDGVSAFTFGTERIQDLAGNSLANATPTGTNDATFIIDHIPPDVFLSGPAGPVYGDFALDVSFSSDVSVYDDTDLTVVNGTISDFTPGANSTASMTITPTADGSVTVDFAADRVEDAAGNGNTAATQYLVTADITPPEVVLSSAVGTHTNAAFFVVLATFTEDMTGVAIDDFTVTNGVASLFQTDNAKQFSVTITPSGQGSVVISIGADTANGTNGNPNLASNGLSVIYDTVLPVAPTDLYMHLSDDGGAGNGDGGAGNSDGITRVLAPRIIGTHIETDATITLTSSLDGVVGSTVANISTADERGFSGNWMVTPSNLTPGTHSITATATDLAGNTGPASAPFIIVVDTTPPNALAFSRVTPAGQVTNADTLVFSAVFDEPVIYVGFDVNGSTATAITTGSGDTYTVTVSGGDLATLNGTVDVDLVSTDSFWSALTDAAGNQIVSLTPASEETYTLDNIAPTVAITGPSGPVAGAFTATVTFSSATDNFAIGDLTVVNGTLSNFQSVSTTVFTATITPIAEGSVTIDVPQGGAADAAGNGNTASPQFSVAYDAAAPGLVSIERFNPISSPTGATSVTWRVTFNELVSNVTADDFTITGTTGTISVNNVSSTVTDVTVSGGDMATVVATLTLGFSACPDIVDAAGRSLSSTTPSGVNDRTYVKIVDATAPQVASIERATPNAAITIAERFVWRVSFDEAVSNVDAADFVVSGTTATITSVTPMSDRIFDITVSGGNLATYNGTIVLSFAAAQNIVDLVGNTLAVTTPTGTNDFSVRLITAAEPFGDEFLVNTTTAANQNVPAIAGGIDGQSLVLWTDYSETGDDTSGSAIRGQMYGPSGAPAGSEFVVNSTTASSQYWPQAVALTGGGYAAAWYDYGGNASDLDGSVRARVLDANGAPIAVDFQVNTSISGGQSLAGITALSGGGFAIIWQQSIGTGPSTYTATVYVQQFDAGGSPLGSETVVVSKDNHGFANGSDITSLPGGGFVVAWIDEDEATVQPSSTFTLDARHFDSASIPDAPFNIVASSTDSIEDVSIAALPGGGYALAWEGASTITARVFDDAGATAGSELTVATSAQFGVFDPQVSSLAGGGFVIAWDGRHSSGDGRDILAQSYLADGTAVGGELLVNSTTAGNQSNPTLAAHADGGFLFGWTDKAATGGDLSGNAVRAQRFGPDVTAPALLAFSRQSPTAALTQADSLVFRATFDEPVGMVSVDDFAVNGTTTAIVSAVSASSGQDIDITVSGGDLASFTGTVGLNLSNSGNISDIAGNGLPGTEPTTDESFTLDNAAPSGYAVAVDQPFVNAANDDAISLTFTGLEIGASYDYALSSSQPHWASPITGSATASSSSEAVSLTVYPDTASALPDGTLTASLALTDSAGNVGVTVTATVLKDTTGPGWTSVNIQPDPVNLSNESAVGLDVSVLETGTTYTYSVTSSGGGAPITGSGSVTSTDFTIPGIDLSGLADGQLTASITMTDAAGNTGFTYTDTATKDTVPPSGVTMVADFPAINAGNIDTALILVTGADDADLSTVVISSSGGGTPSTLGPFASTGGRVAIPFGAAAGLPDGNITFAYQSTDPSGNEGPTTNAVVPKDTVAPSGYSFTIDQDPINLGNVGSVSVSFAGFEPGTTYSYSLSSSGGGAPITGSGTAVLAASTLPGTDASGLADGTITASITLTDAAGNTSAAATDTATKETVAPTLQITGPAGIVGGPFDVTFTFSEDVTGFELSDIVVTRNGSGSGSGGVFVSGAATNFQTINAREYTATITPTSSEYYMTSVGPGRAVDAAGNGNSISASNPFAVLADLAPPSVSVSTTTPPLPGSISHANGPFNVTVSFNEDVAGFTIDDIVVTRREISSAAESVAPNTLSDFQVVSARVYTAILTPPEPSYSTVYYVDIPVDAATDVAGNGNSATSLADHSRFLRIVDNDHPTLIISRIGGAVTALNGPFQIFIRPPGTVGVTGLTIDDVIVSNATTSDFEPQGGGGALLMVTPIAEGPVTVDVPANSVIDSFLNGNIAAPQFVLQYDLTPPSVVISGPPGPISGAFTATFTFSEDATGFAVGDITVGNGAASNVQATSASIYTATITPVADGAVTVDLAGAVTTDIAGNDNSAATQFTVTNDEAAPTLDISGPAGPVSGVFTAIFTFNEDVTGFALGDISVGNGAASDVQATSASVYTATITPAADGAVTLDVAGAAAIDSATNGNTAATQFSVTNDQIAPTGYTFEIDQDPITQANVGAVSLTFAGFELGSTYSYSLSSSGGGTPFTGDGAVAIAGGTLPPIDASTLPDGIITASVTLTDAAGNAGQAVTGGATKDATGPSLLVTGPAGPVSGAFDVVMVFSDPIQGLAFVDDPFAITNGSFGDSELVDALTARQQVLPDADGLVVIDFNADAVADALGNLNTGATLFSVSNDQTSPGLTITGPSVPVNTSALVTFTFDEDVTGFTIDDLNISGGIASNFAVTSATVYTALIGLDPNAAADQEDGVDRPLVGASGYRIDVSVNADTLNDVAGNSNAASGSFPVYYDTVPPVARISAPSASNGPFTVNYTFEESVTGFTADDVIVGNGTLSGFTQTYDCGDPLGVILGSCEIAAVFEAEITPLLEGQVTIDVPNNAFVDVAGNSGSASVQRIVSYDTVSPTTAITGPTGPASGAFTATFTFNENVSNFVLADITVGNGVASNFQAPSASLYNGHFTPTDLFTATITPAADGAVTLDVAGSVATDAAGNDNTAATQFSITNDETAPTLAITGPTGPVSGAFTATFTFDEDVTDFVVGDITVGNGAASAFDDSAAPIYTATITPAADGAVTLDVAGSVATDAAGNDNTAATQFSITNDETAPTLAITGPAGPVSGAFTATFTFDEDVTDFVVGDITVGNGAASAFDDSAAPVYTATITPAADGAVTLDVAGSVATDAAGNDNTAATQFSITNDETAPTLAITGPTGPVSGAFTATFTFDEDVTDFVVGDISVGNGAASAFDDSAAPIYTATITPAADGAVTLDVAGSVATDAAGNDNTAATQFSVTNDETAPTLAITGPTGPVSGAFTATFTFDEDVTDFVVGDITVGNGAASAFDDSAAPVYTATITPAADGAVTLDVAGSVATDAAGNDNAAATQFSITNDETAPTLAITGPAGPVSGAFTATFTFDEDVTDFVVGDITVGNGAASAFDDSAAPVYTATITPAADGAVTLDVAGSVATDAAGNDNTAATQFSITNDETAPTLAITGPAGPVSGAFTATFTFDEDVTDFVVGDITVGNGAASAFDDSAAPVYTATITPAADGAVTLDVAGSVATDAAGNDNTAATQFSITNDETAPTLAITEPAGPVGGAFTATFTFDEDVTDFVVGDITVGNGAASAFDDSAAPVYTATITPAADGAVTLDVAGSVATDAAGNDNTAATQFSITNDETAPTLAITGPAGPVSGAFTATFTFDEDVTDFVVGDITVGNGAASAFDDSAAPVYTATITPAADGAVTLDVAGSVATDAAGNDNTAATQFSITNDETAPTLAITGPAGPVSGAFTATFTFDEDVTDFVVGDITVGNGAASAFDDSAAPVYTATITPAADGAVTLDVAGSVATDAAGNDNTAATQFSITNDETAPTLAITGPTGPVSGAFTATFTFDEDVTDFVVGDITVGNGAASAFDDSAAPVYTATITPAADGAVTLDVAGSVATDAAGNDNAAATQFSVTNDETAPTLAITGPTGPVSGAFTATFTFDEDVTDFVVGDISVGNGAASAFDDSAAPIYTATITPAADGAVTLDVAGSVATDAAGNDNTAATQFSVTNDETAPTLAITGPTGPVSGAFTATFTFDEDVTDFVVGDITVGNGAASAFDDSAAPVYTATITPAADGAVTLDVAGSVATDAAGNDNAAATQFSITNDETAPTLAITGPAGPVSGAFTATFTFDEDVTDFVVGDITVGNGAASAFDDSAAPVYTATITPAADGAVTLDVAGSVATDAAGNDNTAATQFSITNDETAPTLAITGPAGPVSGAFTATFTFDEDVTDFVVGDITVGNGAASAFDDSAAPVYTATITPAADGAVTVDVPGSVATDGAGNDNTAATQFSVTNDETAPTVASITRQTPSVSPTDADSLVWRVTFSETVVNAGAADFSVTGTTATVTDVTAIDGARYDVTASGGDLANLNATVTLSVAAAQDIADEAGNTLSDTTPTGTDERAWSVINDADAPTVASIARNTPSTELTNADSLVWLVSFSENVTDIGTGDFAVSGTTGTVTSVSPQAVNLPPSVTGNGYSAPMVVSSSAFTVTASGGDLASYTGVVTLSFAQGQDITDDAGNALTNTTPSGANENSYTLDNTAPTVALTTTATAPISGPFTLTATFSEDVTGFDVGDLTVGNGTASNFAATSATIYTATITPGAGSSTTVDVASAAAIDAVGNDSTAASQFSIAHDADRTLNVSLPGVGSGTVTSAPVGIDCGTDCSQDYTLGTSVTLTAAADTGSTFAGWTAGPCIGTATATCGVTMSADTSVSARFTLDTPPAGRIVAATLPGARSGYVGGPVISAFLSVVSRTSSPAQSCQVTAPAGAPVTLGYNQLDTNGDPTGPDSPLFDIVPGGALNFVIGMTPTAQTGPDGYSFLPVITCQNASLDPIVGVNDVLLNIGAAPTPDLLSISATPSGDGVIRIPVAGGIQFMSASVINIGIGDGSGGRNEVTLTTTVDTGAATLPLNLEICQINALAICLTPRGPSVTSTMTGSDPLFFAAFVRDTSTGGIPFDPANSRVFLRFTDANGVSRSATSAAVTAPAPADAPEIASSLPQGRWSVLMRQPDGVWPGLARTSLYVTETGQVLVDDGITPRLTTIEAIAADDEDGTQARFMALGNDGVWTSAGGIRLGGPWAEQVGEFWGVRDARSDMATSWTDLAGNFGGNLILSQTGEIRGNIDGCAVYGQASGPATQAATLSLSGCAQSGFYLGLVDLPANDNGQPALLIANGTTGWRVGR